MDEITGQKAKKISNYAICIYNSKIVSNYIGHFYSCHWSIVKGFGLEDSWLFLEKR